MPAPTPAPEATPDAPLLNVDPLPIANVDADDARYGDVVLIVDVLRTTTTVPILFDRGLGGVRLSPSLRRARRAAGRDGDLLIGERGGVPPEGFHHGNSPALLALRDLAGRYAVMVSENAPAALPAVARARTVILASLVNAGAAARVAAARATRRVDIVGCGFRGEPDLDDLATAGFLAERTLRLRPELAPTGAARAAIDLMRLEPDPLRVLWGSRAGRYLRRLGLERDLGVAADVDRSDVVPVLATPEATDGGTLFPFAPADAP